jgi:hypothetical protein
MVTRIINNLKFEVNENLEYKLVGFPPLNITIFCCADRKWVVSVIQPKGKKWEASIYDGFDSLEEAVASMELYQDEDD